MKSCAGWQVHSFEVALMFQCVCADIIISRDPASLEVCKDWSALSPRCFLANIAIMARPISVLALALSLVIDCASADTVPLSVTLDGSTAHHVFDGHGALSAGASSRLLWDYPEPQRSQILECVVALWGQWRVDSLPFSPAPPQLPLSAVFCWRAAGIEGRGEAQLFFRALKEGEVLPHALTSCPPLPRSAAMRNRRTEPSLLTCTRAMTSRAIVDTSCGSSKKP